MTFLACLFLFDNFIIVELFGANNFKLMILRPNASAMWADFPCRKSFAHFEVALHSVEWVFGLWRCCLAFCAHTSCMNMENLKGYQRFQPKRSN